MVSTGLLSWDIHRYAFHGVVMNVECDGCGDVISPGDRIEYTINQVLCGSCWEKWLHD